MGTGFEVDNYSLRAVYYSLERRGGGVIRGVILGGGSVSYVWYIWNQKTGKFQKNRDFFA